MLKSVLRKEALKWRNNLAEAEFNALCDALLVQFEKLDFTHIGSIHVFLPIVKNKEPNTFLFIDWLQKTHPEVQIVVSRSNFEHYTMSSHPYLGKNDLQENRYSIPEPKTEQLFTAKIDMVLVPLLAFDKKGYRVGYGKGFYDRFLTNSKAVKVGVSLVDAVDCIVDVHSDDIKLDYCISPKQIYSFVQ